MDESKRDTARDWTKFDAHVITPEEYDEIPEVTDEMLARAVYSHGEADFDAAVARLRASRLRLDPDVFDGLQASGADWERQGNEVLRAWLRARAA